MKTLTIKIAPGETVQINIEGEGTASQPAATDLPIFAQNTLPEDVTPVMRAAGVVGVHVRFAQDTISSSQVTSMVYRCRAAGLKLLPVLACSDANHVHSRYKLRCSGGVEIPNYWDKKFWAEWERGIIKMNDGIAAVGGAIDVVKAVLFGAGWEDEAVPCRGNSYSQAIATGTPELGVYFEHYIWAAKRGQDMLGKLPFVPQVAPAPNWVLIGLYKRDNPLRAIKANNFRPGWGSGDWEKPLIEAWEAAPGPKILELLHAPQPDEWTLAEAVQAAKRVGAGALVVQREAFQ